MSANLWAVSLLCVGIFLSSAQGSPLSVNGRSKDSVRQSKAEEILKYMNTSVDPCEDFYEFACGNYGQFHPVSREVTKSGILQNLQKDLSEKLKTVLATDEAADTEADKNLKRLYRSCMNLPTTEETFAAQLRAISAEFGQMPALLASNETWDEKNFDWLKTVGEISHQLGISVLLDIAVDIDFADNTVKRLYISQQAFLLSSKAIYLQKENEIYRNKYKANVAKMLKTFLQVSDDVAPEIAAEIVDFEGSLASAMFDSQEGDSLAGVYKLTTLEEVQQEYLPHMDIKKQTDAVLGTIPTHLKVYVQEEYLQHLLKTVPQTPKKVVANYIFFKLLKNFIFPLGGSEEIRHDGCLLHIRPYFYKHLDEMIYRQYALKDAEEPIKIMWQTLKTTFEKSLKSEKLNWINETTRKYAVEKLKAMKVEILSYENYNFNKDFQDLVIDEENFLENIRQLQASNMKKLRAKNSQTTEKFDFGELLPLTPLNILLENSVKIPVALLEPYTTWSGDFPNSFNFATLGGLLSHELLHGFDNGGRTFDLQGNQRVWWDSESSRQFDERTKCFIDQYKEYVYGDLQFTGMTNQDENIADNGGFRLAYEAYLKWLDESALSAKRQLDLESWPGLDDYNQKQMFFISCGQLWCSETFPEYENLMETSSIHVLDKFRVIGPLSNYDEFAKEFKCPEGSAMNPGKKCKIF